MPPSFPRTPVSHALPSARSCFYSRSTLAFSSHKQQLQQLQRTKRTASTYKNVVLQNRNRDKKSWTQLSPAQKVDKVKSAAKVTTNFGIVALGTAVLGILAFAVGKELFSADSSTNVFSNALEKVRGNRELVKILGSPVLGHGAPSRRRNSRPAYQYITDGEGRDHMIMMFYVEGPRNTGTAYADCVKNKSGNWEYQLLYVDVPGNGLRGNRYILEQNANAGMGDGHGGGLAEMIGRATNSIQMVVRDLGDWVSPDLSTDDKTIG